MEHQYDAMPGSFPTTPSPGDQGHALPPNEHVQVQHEYVTPHHGGQDLSATSDFTDQQGGYYPDPSTFGQAEAIDGRYPHGHHLAAQLDEAYAKRMAHEQHGHAPPLDQQYPPFFAYDQYRQDSTSPVGLDPVAGGQGAYDRLEPQHYRRLSPEAAWHDEPHQSRYGDLGLHDQRHTFSDHHGMVSPDDHRLHPTQYRPPNHGRVPLDHVDGGPAPYSPDRSPHRRQGKTQSSCGNQQKIQIVMPDSAARPAKDDSGSSVKQMTEQVQMMMMNQMMAQQMSAQQMQFAQMNAMMSDKGQRGGGRGGNGGSKKKRKGKPAVNIKTKQVGRRARPPAPIIAIQPPAAGGMGGMGTIESAAMENWQEATIILCIALVGVIYLVVSRSSKEQEKEASLAAKHLVPK